MDRVMAERDDQLREAVKVERCPVCGRTNIACNQYCYGQASNKHDKVRFEWVPMVPEARLAAVEAERDRFRDALIECATASGADVSDGPPTWPAVDVWAVEEVKRLREDCDEEAERS